MPTYKKKTTVKKGGPGKGGPGRGKSPSSMFKVKPMPKAKAAVTKKSSATERRAEIKRLGQQMKALNEKKRGLSKSGKATTMGPGKTLSSAEQKAQRDKINKQMAALRKKRSGLTTNREVIKSKVKRTTEKIRGSVTPGAGKNGKCTPVQACSKLSLCQKQKQL